MVETRIRACDGLATTDQCVRCVKGVTWAKAWSRGHYIRYDVVIWLLIPLDPAFLDPARRSGEPARQR